MLRTVFFILSISGAGLLIDIIIIGLASFKERSSLDIRARLVKTPFYFAFGAAGYTFYAALLSINGVNLSLFSFFCFVSSLLLIALMLYGRSFKNVIRLSYPKVDLRSLLILAGFLAIAAFLGLKMLQRMSFVSFDIDLLGHLLSKAKILLFTTYRDSFFFHDQLFSNLHTSYPPMFGIFYNLLFLFLKGPYNSYFHVVNYFIVFCLSLSLYSFLSGKIRDWQALAWSFVLVSAPNYLRAIYIMDNADVMLSLFFLLSLIELFKFLKTKQVYHLLTLAFLAGGAALLKNEGLVFAFYVTLVLFFYIWFKAGLKSFKEKLSLLASFLVPLIFLSAFWWVYQLSLPKTENTLLSGNPLENLGFFLAVCRIYSQEVLSLNWQAAFILWVLFGLILRSQARRDTLFLSLLLGLQFMTYFLLFYIGQGKALTTFGHVSSGLRRGLAHIYPLAFAIAALIIGRFLNPKPKAKR